MTLPRLQLLAGLFLFGSLTGPAPAEPTAEQPRRAEVVLGSGERAVVLVQDVQEVRYVKALQMDGAVKGVARQGTLQVGWQVVQKADGSCLRLERELRALEDVVTIFGTFQAPLLHVEEQPAPCPAEVR